MQEITVAQKWLENRPFGKITVLCVEFFVLRGLRFGKCGSTDSVGSLKSFSQTRVGPSRL